jgi:uncharacterized membrane protein YdjX (TVP38/TMEM64 family)
MADESGLTREDRKELKGVGALALCWAILPAVGGFTLLAQLSNMSAYLNDLGSLGIAVYVGIFAVTSGLGLLPTYAQAILGGWVFGLAVGLTGAIAGIALGALIGYLIARVVGGKAIEGVLARRPQFSAIHSALLGRGPFRTTSIVGLLRLSPNSPFALFNLAMGSAKTPLFPYLVGTAVGVLPRTAIAAGIAAAAASDGSTGLLDVIKNRGLPMTIVGIAVLIGAFLIVGAIGKQALAKVVHDPSRTTSDDAAS